MGKIKKYCCIMCGEIDSDNFYNHMKSLCRRCHNDKMLIQQKKIRDEILITLGNKCIRCGYDDVRALHIDHVNGFGRKDRGEKYSRYRYLKSTLSDLKNGSTKYQLLCANCNFIKLIEKRENINNRLRSSR